jgi:hypothetical protein
VKRWWKLLLVLGVVVSLALPAGAIPKFCEPGSEHPACKDAPAPEPDLWTCDARRANGAVWTEGKWDGRAYVSKEVVAIPLCIDVAAHKDVVSWTVEWEEGEARKAPKGLKFVFEEEVPGAHYAEFEVKPTATKPDITSGCVVMTLTNDDGDVRHLAFVAMGHNGDKWTELTITATPNQEECPDH